MALFGYVQHNLERLTCLALPRSHGDRPRMRLLAVDPLAATFTNYVATVTDVGYVHALSWNRIFRLEPEVNCATMPAGALRLFEFSPAEPST